MRTADASEAGRRLGLGLAVAAGVWFIGDEPSPECPGVDAEHRARTEQAQLAKENAWTDGS